MRSYRELLIVEQTKRCRNFPLLEEGTMNYIRDWRTFHGILQ